MAPGIQLTSAGAVAGDDSVDLEDVRLLDSYDKYDDGNTTNTKRIQVSISGMTCAACSNSVEAALNSVAGVSHASVALLQNRADVVFNPTLVKVGHSLFSLS